MIFSQIQMHITSGDPDLPALYEKRVSQALNQLNYMGKYTITESVNQKIPLETKG